MSQEELALRAGVTQDTIEVVESGKRLYMRSDHLARLVKALGVSADEVLGTTPAK
jgi:transcriptional regulator with XRE-family HTH domain